MFDRNVVITYEKQKEGERAKEKQDLEKKIAEKRAKRAELKCKLAGKQKMFDFGPFDPSYLNPFEMHLIKQKMKTMVIVDNIQRVCM